MTNEPLFCDNCGGLDKGEQAYTADSFETCFKWKCRLLNGKVISSEVDWNDHNISPLSDCPLQKEKTTRTPKEKINENYREKYLKKLKEVKILRRELTKIRRTFKKIHELSSH